VRRVAKVHIKNEGVTIDVPDGADLRDYLKANSSMVFGCERGECGMCICHISKGADNLVPRSAQEGMTLAKKANYPTQRLACQLRIKKGEIEIEY